MAPPDTLPLEQQIAEARARAAAARAERERLGAAIDALDAEAKETRKLLVEYDSKLPIRLAETALGERPRRSYTDLVRDRRCAADFLNHVEGALRHLHQMQQPHSETHAAVEAGIAALERQLRDTEIRETALKIIAGGDFGDDGRNRPGPLLDAVKKIHPLADASDLRRVMRW